MNRLIIYVYSCALLHYLLNLQAYINLSNICSNVAIFDTAVFFLYFSKCMLRQSNTKYICK
jgi:hypothetical protein